jgi:transposase
VTPAGTDDDQRSEPDVRVAELATARAAHDAELAGRDARIAELELIVVKLTAEVERLTERLRQNSSNSHLPPSSDGPGAAARGERRPKQPSSKRKRGGQKGRRGAHRALRPPEQVDDFVELFPDACEGCSAALPQTLDVDPRRYQVLELLGSRPHLTEIRRHEVECHCGHRTLAAYDPEKIPSSPFGPRLTSVVAMLTGAYHLSRRRTQQLLREVFEIEVSLGAVSAMEARASESFVPAVEEAQRAVEQAEVKHTDATSWLRAGVTKSLWTIASTIATVFRIVEDGRRDTLRPLLGTPKGILVSDRASVFDFWSMKQRQVCWSHIIRRFVSFSERSGTAGAIGRELLDCAALVFEYWHGFRDGALTRDELVVWMRPLQRQLLDTLQRAVAADIRGLSGSCADILAHRDALWTFVTHEGVDPTNNHAERELRAFVLWRKKSFGSQSDRGERFAERVMTVVHTARKAGKNVLEFLIACCTARAHSATPPSLLGLAPAYRPP